MEMEYHGTWWTGIEHEDFRTKTYDLGQHHFMADLDSEAEVYVDALTADGFEFSFQYTKKTDPVYALEPTKKHPEGRKWTGTTWVNTKERLDLPICPTHGKPFALMDSGASHVLLPLHMLNGPDLDVAKKIQVNLAVGHSEGRMFRDEVYADGKVHKLVPIGRVIDHLGLTLLWSKRGGELRCPDGKKTHLFMRFTTKGNMQYITENQFELLRKALWTSAINSAKAYDATFWRHVIRNGFDKHLQRIHDYPQSCNASITFTYDCEMDTSESASESECDTIEYVSDVLLGRCELASA
eukprot:6466176-Amphidinium_carterae.1